MIAMNEADAADARAASTWMFREAAEAADVVAAQLAANRGVLSSLAEELQRGPPPFVATCARGSSDHAATYAKALLETRLGVVTSSLSPSVGSVYATPQRMRGALFIAISQSGRSPDLLRNVEAAREAGARVVALVNVADSPLAAMADVVVPLHAGPERSVAATKSFLASLSAILQLGALWSGDAALLEALERLPEAMRKAWACDWSQAVEGLAPARNLFVISRGLGLAAAQEAALKFKETCGLHAEAYSSAEVKHGPMALVGPGFPVLVLAQPDATQAGTQALADEFRERGAQVWLALNGGRGNLPVADAPHPACAPLLLVQSFYRMVNALALARGHDPDQPPHLNKVTETV